MAKVCEQCGREFENRSVRCPICKLDLVSLDDDNFERARMEQQRMQQARQARGMRSRQAQSTRAMGMGTRQAHSAQVQSTQVQGRSAKQGQSTQAQGRITRQTQNTQMQSTQAQGRSTRQAQNAQVQRMRSGQAQDMPDRQVQGAMQQPSQNYDSNATEYHNDASVSEKSRNMNAAANAGSLPVYEANRRRPKDIEFDNWVRECNLTEADLQYIRRTVRNRALLYYFAGPLVLLTGPLFMNAWSFYKCIRQRTFRPKWGFLYGFHALAMFCSFLLIIPAIIWFVAKKKGYGTGIQELMKSGLVGEGEISAARREKFRTIQIHSCIVRILAAGILPIAHFAVTFGTRNADIALDISIFIFLNFIGFFICSVINHNRCRQSGLYEEAGGKHDSNTWKPRKEDTVNENDPGTWTESYASLNRAECIATLQAHNLMAIDFLQKGKDLNALAYLGRVPKGMLIMGRGESGGFHMGIALCYECKARITAFGSFDLDVSERQQREEALGYLKLAYDIFSALEEAGGGMADTITTMREMVADFRSGRPLAHLKAKYAADFPLHTIDLLTKVNTILSYSSSS